MNDASDPSSERNDVAIIGIGCRFPGVHGTRAFWDLIQSDRSTVSAPPLERVALGYDIDRYLDPRPRIPGRISSPYAGFLEHPDLFDPTPFGVTPRDVRAMEPQQRLMLEATWDAIVDAGIPIDSLQGERVAVILGHMVEDYSRERIAVLGEDTVNRGLDVFSVSGMSRAVMSGRIAFLLGVTGPSLTLDTACSSSLIATHLACQSLRTGESRLALAGGVNLFLTPEGNIALSRSGMLSPDGACKAFDEGANGFVRGEGAGVVLLRPLRDALAHGDPIYAVIRGTGISTDGRDGGHMMAPGRHGQAQAMRDAYAQAGVSPADVDFVETHGTGTVIGDPVEIGALADVMGPGRSPERPLRVSSVKGHIGHSESASGIAGLICASLALTHRRLPAQMHFERPSSQIPWDEVPIRVQVESEPWPGDGPRLAGVNSFGISGTNAHVVLESAPEPVSRGRDERGASRSRLIPISAHDAGALQASLEQLVPQLRGDAPPALDDLAYTLGQRRQQHAHRFVTVADSPAALADEIEGRLAGHTSGASAAGVASPAAAGARVLVFPGQGAQTAGMGRQLYAEEPVFRATVEALDAAYARHADWSLVDALLDPERVGTLERLSRLQPTLVGIEIALAELWAHWGIRPDIVVGQSLGEIAAAHAAGVLDLDDVARLACHRGAIVERTAGQGAMALVGLGEAAAYAEIADAAGRIEVAGSSSPTSTIVSGDRGPVEGLVARLTARDVFARRLDVDFASHCFHMDPLLADFRSAIESLRPAPESVPFYSTVDAAPLDGDQLDADYWVRNLRAPVSFTRTLARLIEDGARQIVEVSPHPTLARAVPETAASVGAQLDYVGSLIRGRDECATMRGGLARLYANGATVDFSAEGPSGQVLRSDPYPYQRRRFWFGSRTRADMVRPSHALLGPRVDVATERGTTLWQKTLDLDDCPFLDDYRIEDRPTLPAALYVELALGVAHEVWPDETSTIRELSIWPMLALGDDPRVTLQLSLRRDGSDSGDLTIMSRGPAEEAWSRRATCRIDVGTGAAPDARPAERVEEESGESITPDDWHAALAAQAVGFGRRLRTVRALTRTDGATLLRLALPPLAESESHAYRVHPALLEPCLALAGPDARASTAVSVDEIVLHASVSGELDGRVHGPSEARGAAIDLTNAEGHLVLSLRGVRSRPLGSSAPEEHATPVALHPLTWRRLEQPTADTPHRLADWTLWGEDADTISLLATELEKHGARCRLLDATDGVSPDPIGRATEHERSAVAFVTRADGRTLSGSTRRHIEDLLDELIAQGASPETVFVITIGRAPFGDVSASTEATPASPRRIAPGDRPSTARRVGVSIDAADPARALRALAPWLTAGFDEPALAWRDDEMWAPRAAAPVACKPPDAALVARANDGVAFSARVVAGGEPEPVALIEEPVAEPGPGEVRIAVEAACLDPDAVRSALGMPGPADDGLPAHVAGTVDAVGPGQHAVRIGDRVVARTRLARFARAPAEHVIPIPDALDASLAAGQLPALIGARRVLDEIDAPASGRSIWVHGGDDEIGSATIALARAAGANVLASAVTGERAAVLEQVGVVVLPTTSADMTDAVLAATGGIGVDRIINFEPRVPIHGSLRALRTGGRLIDAHPRDATDPGPIDGLVVTGGRSLHACSSIAETGPSAVPAATIASALEQLSGGHPGLPAPISFPVEDLARALRYRGQSRAAEPVTVHFHAPTTRIRPADGQPRLFDPDTAYALVCTDASSAEPFAAWMRERGAAHVVVTTPGEARRASRPDLRTPDIRGVVAIGDGLTRAQGVSGRAPDDTEAATALNELAGSSDLAFFVCVHAADEWAQSARERGEEPDPVRSLVAARRARSLPATTVRVADPTRWSAIVGALESALVAPKGADDFLARSRDGRDAGVDPDAAVFAELDPSAADGAARASLRQELAALTSPQLAGRVLGLLGDAVAVVIGMGEADRSRLCAEAALDELGLDSLMTLELAVGLQGDLGLDLDRGTLAPGRSLGTIASEIAEQLAPDLAAARA